MKTCPTCHRAYADDTINFCLEDGAVLSAARDSQPTQPYPSARNTEPPATQVMPSIVQPPATLVAPPQVPARDDRQIYQTENRPKRWPLIAGAVALVAVAGVIIAIVAGAWILNRDSAPTQQSSDSGLPKKDATPKSTWSPAAEDSKTSETAERTPAPEPQLEMSGTWAGTFDEYPARLVITDTEGNSFTGDLSGKTFEVIVQGAFNPTTRAITFRETRVVRDNTWVLGANAGTMSPDGRKISGTGKADGSYTWSFSKQ